MGYLIKNNVLTKDKMNKLLTPLIFCIELEKVEKYLSSYKLLDINTELAKALLKYNKGDRKDYVALEFNRIIDGEDCPILITNFEMLFNPFNNIDVLKLFILANRNKKLGVLWCGKYENETLKFADIGYEDYATYNIKNYDITCII